MPVEYGVYIIISWWQESSCSMVEGMGTELQSNLQDEKEQRQVH